MKLAELSKPLMPSIAAANPKKSAWPSPVEAGRCQFAEQQRGIARHTSMPQASASTSA